MHSTPKFKTTRSTSNKQQKPCLPLHDDEATQTQTRSESVIQMMQRELVLLQETITKIRKNCIS